jgi:ABC-type phosphate/phosphonate transport system substrate-binding protein
MSRGPIAIGKTVCTGSAAALVALLLGADAGHTDTEQVPVLHIGSTEAFVADTIPAGSDGTDADAIHRHFIRATTGFRSAVAVMENHEVLAERLASGKLQLGIFMGYEFAWAQARHPKLQVLAVAVNEHLYRYPTLIVHRDGPVSDLADLQGRALAIPRSGQGYGQLFVAAQSRRAGQDPHAFLESIDSVEDSETPLDEVGNKTREAAVVERFALEAYERRRPGRSTRLKKLSESAPMPPALIAYYDGNLDPPTVTRLRDELTRAHQQAAGKQLLTLLRLTGFAAPPPDFQRVLADTRRTHPAPVLKRRIEAHPVAVPGHSPNFRAEALRLAVLGSLDDEPRQGDAEYYLSVFAYESAPRRPQYAHTFATFIRSSGDSIEAHTISWLPRSEHIEVARPQSEPGMNLDLDQTLRLARRLSARVYEWGPYRIRHALYQRSLRQIERLNSGRIEYKALDGAWRPDTALSCTHAVSDVDADAGYLTVDGAYGVAASARVVEHLSRWMIEAGREHPSIRDQLGLSGQPIIRVAYRHEPAAVAE